MSYKIMHNISLMFIWWEVLNPVLQAEELLVKIKVFSEVTVHSVYGSC